MRDAFHKLFWGYLLVIVEINIINIDILPEPVGYLLLFLGISALLNKYEVKSNEGRYAEMLAVGLIILSIPTVFIPQNSIETSVTVLSGWGIYTIVLSLLKLTLVFFIFQIIQAIDNVKNNQYFARSVHHTFRVYITIMLLIYFAQPFMINLTNDFIVSYGIITAIVGLILEIVFLVLLRRCMRITTESSPRIA